jgi:plastocyanin
MYAIRTSKFDFRHSALSLVAILSLMTLGGPSASSASQSAGGLGNTRAAASASATAGASTGSEVEVKIDNFVFAPAVLTVKAGAQVTWVNKDDIPHTVDSTEGKFKSAALDTDDKFQFRFTEPGEYPFYCRMHPKMTGKIIVQPE